MSYGLLSFLNFPLSSGVTEKSSEFSYALFYGLKNKTFLHDFIVTRNAACTISH